MNDATTITATSPAGTGTVDVTVSSGGGTSATSAVDQFTYDDGPPPGSIPSPVDGGWQLNGSAVLDTTGSPANLQLTPATNWVVGSAFWPTPVSGVGMTAAFDAYIGPGAGADGLTFTLADASVTTPTALGNTGGGEGFAGINGIAVSLDTWQNTSDPSNNFVGIATTSAPMQSLNYVATNASIPSLVDTVHHFVVTTTSTGVTVTMDGTQVLDDATALPPYVLVGFTGATGGFNDVHQVQNVSITAGPPPPAPTVTGVSPASGPSTGGTAVTITGTNFTGASGVHFGLNAAVFTVDSDTSITATAPTGSDTVDVTVTAIGRTSATNANDQYTYEAGPPPPPPPPTVTALDPASGPDAGGTAVTITGTNFTGATAVSFGANAATFSVDSDTGITATAPAGSGTVDVTVTTAGGTSATNANDHYTFVAGPPPPPTVTSVNPISGPAGTLVSIVGTSLTGATEVDFGPTPATFTVNTATTITATAPAGTDTVDVTVTTPQGTSATSEDDQFTYTAGTAAGAIPSPVDGGWQLNGAAQLDTTSTPPNLQVTPTTNWVAGSAFWPTPVPGAGITATFDSYIGRRGCRRDDLHPRRRERHPTHRARQQRRR